MHRLEFACRQPTLPLSTHVTLTLETAHTLRGRGRTVSVYVIGLGEELSVDNCCGTFVVPRILQPWHPLAQFRAYLPSTRVYFVIVTSKSKRLLDSLYLTPPRGYTRRL